MNNIIEFETDRELSSAEMLHQLARRAENGEITNAIVMVENTETENVEVHVAEKQSQRDLFWQLSSGADVIMRS